MCIATYVMWTCARGHGRRETRGSEDSGEGGSGWAGGERRSEEREKDRNGTGEDEGSARERKRETRETRRIEDRRGRPAR